MIHGIEQITGKVKVLKDGKFEMVNPLEEIKVSYPKLAHIVHLFLVILKQLHFHIISKTC